MKLAVTKEQGKSVNVRIAEESDKDKLLKAIAKVLKTESTIGQKHYSIIPDSLVVITINSNVDSRTLDANGYKPHRYEAEATFRAGVEYNPQPDGKWGNHKFKDFAITISFIDSHDGQIANIYEPKLSHYSLTELFTKTVR
jgi:hypothetical protein